MSLDDLRSQINVTVSAAEGARAIIEMAEQLQSHCRVFGAAYSLMVSGAGLEARLAIDIDLSTLMLTTDVLLDDGSDTTPAEFDGLGAPTPPYVRAGDVLFYSPARAAGETPDDPGFGEDHRAREAPLEPVTDRAGEGLRVEAHLTLSPAGAGPAQEQPDLVPAALAADDITDAEARRAAAYTAGTWAGHLPAKWPLTAAERHLADRMMDDNAGASAIAAALGRDPRGFYHILNKLPRAVPPKPAPAPKPPVPARVADATDPIGNLPSAPASMADADARVAQRIRHLARPAGWSWQDDLALVEGLSAGRKLADLAPDLAREVPMLRTRYAQLCPAGGIEEQMQVLRALRLLTVDRAA